MMSIAFHPSDPLIKPPAGLVYMRHGVMGPGFDLFHLGRLAPRSFGSVKVVAFLQPKGEQAPGIGGFAMGFDDLLGDAAHALRVAHVEIVNLSQLGGE